MSAHRDLVMSPSSPQRMLAPDLARGAMLLLIVLAHAPLYLVGLETGALQHPTGGTALDQAVRTIGLLTVDNRAYPMFAALFGYGIVMSITRQQRRDGGDASGARRLLRRRGWWLLAFGLAHALVITPIEILGAYGLATLLFGWIFFRGERTLQIWAAILSVWYLLAIAVVSYLDHAPGTEEDPAWHETAGLLGYGPADMLERLVGWLFAAVSNNLIFPIVIALLIGGWAAKRRVLEEPHRHRRLLRVVAVLGLTVSLLGALPLILSDAGRLPAEAAWMAQSLHIVSGVFGGLAYTAIFGLLGAHLQHRQPGVVRILAAVGKRSLTCYLFQSALLIMMLSQVFLGLGDKINSAGAALVALVAWLGGLTLAWLLERSDRPGPADALLRRLVTRGRKPPHMPSARIQTPASGQSDRPGRY